MTDAFYDSSVLVLPLSSTALNAKCTQDFSRIAALATLSGDAEISNGRCNFYGNGYVTVPASTYYTIGTGDFTVSAKFGITANSVPNTGGGRQALLLSIDDGVNASLEINVGGNATTTGNSIWAYSYGNGNIAQQSVSVTKNVEHELSMVRKSGVIHYYYDDVELGTGKSNTSSLGGNTVIHIGGRPWSVYQHYLIGWIRDVRIDTFARYSGPYDAPVALDNPEWTIGGAAVRGALKSLSGYEDVPPSASHISGPRTVVPDYYDGGDGKIVGLVDKIGGAPVSCRVVLHRLRDGRPIRETRSSAAGEYAFTYVDRSELYYVIAFSPDGAYRAVVADRMTAEPM